MYLCRTLGELLRMPSGCFCCRSNNVWFWKEQALVSFTEMKCQKRKKNMALTAPAPPSLFCVWWSKLMKQRAPTACHSHLKHFESFDCLTSHDYPSQNRMCWSSVAFLSTTHRCSSCCSNHLGPKQCRRTTRILAEILLCYVVLRAGFICLDFRQYVWLKDVQSKWVQWHFVTSGQSSSTKYESNT